MRRFLLTILASAFTLPAVAKTLAYGERIGMEVTIIKKSGIGTTHAKIITRHTRQNAIGYCRDYVGKVTEACIAKELKTPLHLKITANCKTGAFTTLYGANMLFKGRNTDGDAAGYLITDIESRQTLDGSGASSYGSTIEQFSALCPNRVK
ncbi:MAG TPA: hypothetical protein VNR41_03160 [Xanthobacteraceae bacterium]|jgi:hypothetical protein|nr:hypothetical protein [Xanthobacteraceae bacterium]